MASCKRALGIAKQGGTAGISILWPVLDVFEDGSFYLSSLPPVKRGGGPSKHHKMPPVKRGGGPSKTVEGFKC